MFRVKKWDWKRFARDLFKVVHSKKTDVRLESKTYIQLVVCVFQSQDPENSSHIPYNLTWFCTKNPHKILRFHLRKLKTG